MSTTDLVRVTGLCRHNLRLWVSDLHIPIILVGMPLVMMAFLQPIHRDALAAQGVVGATGAEQAVPGMAVMFSFFAASIASQELHRERVWKTWDRVRASGATTGQVILGKVAPPLAIIAAQLVVLFVAGGLLFDLQVRGSMPGLVLVGAALAATMLATGLALASLIRSITTLGAAGNILSVTMAGLGGALTPLSSLPAWASAMAPAVPTYWAMRGFRAAILPDGGLAEAVAAAGVLTAFAVGLTVLAGYRFRRAEG